MLEQRYEGLSYEYGSIIYAFHHNHHINSMLHYVTSIHLIYLFDIYYSYAVDECYHFILMI